MLHYLAVLLQVLQLVVARGLGSPCPPMGTSQEILEFGEYKIENRYANIVLNENDFVQHAIPLLGFL